MRLNGKTALVTGAASGFGAEIAATFAREGAKVVIMDLNGEGAEATAKSIGAAARAIKGDVTKAADIEAAVAATVAFGGKLDIVVNNAGWTHRNKPMLEVTEEEFDRVYDINVRSIFHMSRAAVPLMQKQGGGVPPEKWSSLMYGFWADGGLKKCRERDTVRKRSSRSCGRLMFCLRRADRSLTPSDR